VRIKRNSKQQRSLIHRHSYISQTIALPRSVIPLSSLQPNATFVSVRFGKGHQVPF
jgi:hypothetical protein